MRSEVSSLASRTNLVLYINLAQCHLAPVSMPVAPRLTTSVASRSAALMAPGLDDGSESGGVSFIDDSKSVYSYDTEDDATDIYRPSTQPGNCHSGNGLGRNGQQRE